MREFLATILTVLILACPFVCGADEVGHRAQHGHGAGNSGHDDAPDNCPETSDNCVCRGAVHTGDVRTIAHASAVGWIPLASLIPPLVMAGPLHRVAWGGSPTGLTGWGDSLTVRALLQNFRC